MGRLSWSLGGVSGLAINISWSVLRVVVATAATVLIDRMICGSLKQWLICIQISLKLTPVLKL